MASDFKDASLALGARDDSVEAVEEMNMLGDDSGGVAGVENAANNEEKVSDQEGALVVEDKDASHTKKMDLLTDICKETWLNKLVYYSSGQNKFLGFVRGLSSNDSSTEATRVNVKVFHVSSAGFLPDEDMDPQVLHLVHKGSEQARIAEQWHGFHLLASPYATVGEEEEASVENQEVALVAGAAAPRTLSHMEALSDGAMTHLLQLVELPTRIKLAAASKALQRLIYEDCSALWVKIVLSPKTLPFTMRESITDDLLAALLLRVNAREVTEYLVVCGCPDIRGSGLEPLRNSEVLGGLTIGWGQTVTFDWQQQVLGRYRHFNIATPANILRTMFPYNLTHVELPGTRRNAKARQDFLLELRETVHRRVIDQGTECSTCGHPVRKASRQIVPDEHGLPSTHCHSCVKQFCRTSACAMELQACNRCGKVSCAECDTVKHCGGCHKTLCDECCAGFSPDCFYCKEKFCADECNGDAITCSKCNKTVCDNCAENNDVDYIYACDKCNENHCTRRLRRLQEKVLCC